MLCKPDDFPINSGDLAIFKTKNTFLMVSTHSPKDEALILSEITNQPFSVKHLFFVMLSARCHILRIRGETLKISRT